MTGVGVSNVWGFQSCSMGRQAAACEHWDKLWRAPILGGLHAGLPMDAVTGLVSREGSSRNPIKVWRRS